jgi:hypothetical protein
LHCVSLAPLGTCVTHTKPPWSTVLPSRNAATARRVAAEQPTAYFELANPIGQDERFVVRVESRHTPNLGDIVYVKPRVGAHHAFHAVSGERL